MAEDQPTAEDQPRRRGSFGPLVLLGLAGAGVAAFAGSRGWVTPADGGPEGAGDTVAQVATSAADSSSPLTTAVALVVLAAWGVVLVTRGRFRRVVALLTAVFSAALFASSVAGFVAAPQALTDLLESYGATEVGVDRTAWSFVAVGAAALALVAAALSTSRVSTWPEMGRRYDAPASAPTAPTAPTAAGAGGTGDSVDADDAGRPDPDEVDNLALWKQIDEGRDPTA